MWWWIALIGFAGTPGQPPAPRVQIADGRANYSVVQAVLGAQRRLARPECQRLLTDFRDNDGHPLADVLRATAAAPDDYLVRRILFFGDDDGPQCRRDEVVVAFTSPGYKVVHICGARFAKRFER